MSLFNCLGCTKGSVQTRDQYTLLSEGQFYGEELLAPLTTPMLEDPPLLGCTRLLIQNIRSYPPYWRPSLHPQPEDAPYRDDRDPLPTTGPLFCLTNIISTAIHRRCGRSDEWEMLTR